MRNKKNYHESIESGLEEYCTQVKDLKENPREVIGEEFLNALLCRNGLEEDLQALEGDPEYEKYRKRLAEADKTLKELLSTKDTELVKLILKKYSAKAARGEKGWWWHPEKINPEALKYLPPDWPKDC